MAEPVNAGLLDAQLALNPVLLDPLAQSGAGDAEQFGGVELVAAGLFKRLDHQLALDRRE